MVVLGIAENGYWFLFRMIKAPMTPGIHPQRVSRNTMSTEPHPRSITAKGGKIIANNTCKQVIVLILLLMRH